jgi:polysaccharide export outer membrane protein
MKQSLNLCCLALAAVGLLAPRGAAAQQPRFATAPPPVARPAAAAPAAIAPDTKPLPEAPYLPEYQLGAGDKLRIEVYRDTQLSQSVQIRPDGKITLPLVGDIAASGKTPAELDEVITRALKEYMNNPSVTVIVVEATAATAYIVGGVNHPGEVKLLGPVTVLQALALAGGLTDFADKKNIRILRKGVTGTQSIPFNYKDAIKGMSAASALLRAGDTVVVPD